MLKLVLGGAGDEEGVYNEGITGSYRASTMSGGGIYDSYMSRLMIFTSDFVYDSDNLAGASRSLGYSVRCILD